MSRKKILFICLGILIGGFIIAAIIFSTEPEAKQESATKKSAMLVETVSAEYGTFIPKISGTGTVRPVEDVILSPLVAGQVIRRDPSFSPGGFVVKGEVLLQLDPSDYRNTLELRKSELLQAKTDRHVEMGRQKVAEQDLALVNGDTLSPEEQSLVLRKPQLQAVDATISAAEASVSQAQLNLQRTTIKAPFDAHILTQNVTVGSQVSPGDNLGRLVGTDIYWVELNLPVTQLRWLHFPNNPKDLGSKVKIRSRGSWDEGAFRIGELYRQVGALDNQTRMARVLVKVEDPMGRHSDSLKAPHLMIGSFVEAEIEAQPISDVIRIHRDYVRTNQTVWVMADGKLNIRKVKILLTDSRYAYISNGLKEEEKVVITNISTVTEGIGLRTENSKSTKPLDTTMTD
ncbi:efflux RND transporter periplasmic adaptor subunit [Aegicerativicinus sediminis]